MQAFADVTFSWHGWQSCRSGHWKRRDPPPRSAADIRGQESQPVHKALRKSPGGAQGGAPAAAERAEPQKYPRSEGLPSVFTPRLVSVLGTRVRLTLIEPVKDRAGLGLILQVSHPAPAP